MRKRNGHGYAWKGGRVIDQFGYVHVWAPDHFQALKNGYVAEHRLVMANHLGRRLKSTEIVHHINENKQDNRLENLEITTTALHGKEHNHLGRHKERPHLYKGKCSFKGCGDKAGFKSGLCRKHYQANWYRRNHGIKRTA